MPTIPSQIETLMSAASTAVESADYATARSKAAAALALMAAIPDGSKDGVEMEWDRQAIERFLDQVEKLSQRTANVVGTTNAYGLTKINYQRPEGTSEQY